MQVIMGSYRILLLVGAFVIAAAATKLGEQIEVHSDDKPTDEKTENVKRVSLCLLDCFVLLALNAVAECKTWKYWDREEAKLSLRGIL